MDVKMRKVVSKRINELESVKDGITVDAVVREDGKLKCYWCMIAYFEKLELKERQVKREEYITKLEVELAAVRTLYVDLVLESKDEL